MSTLVSFVGNCVKVKLNCFTLLEFFCPYKNFINFINRDIEGRQVQDKLYMRSSIHINTYVHILTYTNIHIYMYRRIYFTTFHFNMLMSLLFSISYILTYIPCVLWVLNHIREVAWLVSFYADFKYANFISMTSYAL